MTDFRVPEIRPEWAYLCSTKIIEAAMPVSLVANVVWRDVAMGNLQLSQLLHSISNIKGDLGNLLHRQAGFKRRNDWLHQHSLPDSAAVVELPSCQEAHKVPGTWRQPH